MAALGVFEISIPTKNQVVSGVEKVVATFVVAAFATWRLFPHPFSKAALLGAGFAGVMAVYQLVISVVTTLPVIS